MDGWSNRIENTMAQGGLIIHPRMKSFGRAGFKHNESMLMFTPYGWHSLEEIINDVLQNSEKYDTVRNNAKEIISNNHTWQHKLLYIERIVNDPQNSDYRE